MTSDGWLALVISVALNLAWVIGVLAGRVRLLLRPRPGQDVACANCPALQVLARRTPDSAVVPIGEAVGTGELSVVGNN